MKIYPLSRKENLVVQELDGEVLIYDLTRNKAFCLNETSAIIWQSCDGAKSTAQIAEIISKKSHTPANEDLIWLAIEQLKKENLIENANDLPDYFNGMSRRNIIKKVGLGTMIALPIVAGITAPLAIQAASSCVTGGVCQCNTPMGLANGEVCTTSPPQNDGMGNILGISCTDTNCRCIRTNQGNAAGTCQH